MPARGFVAVPLAVTFALAGASGAPAQGAPNAPAASPAVRLNQLGFYPAGPKTAVVADSAASAFAVLTADGRDTVFRGTLSPPRRWAPADEVVRTAEFGGLTRPGPYVLAVPNVGRSHPFVVGDTVLRPLARAALKAFYFQRASTTLPARYAGRWARPAGHPDTAVLVHPSAAGPGRPAGTRLAAPGGWYDAGDYNKYVVNSGISTYTLLALAEHFPTAAAVLDAGIPESGGALPDALDEALWNLDWMRAMQDPGDGGVYHKLTTAEFSGFVVPNADTAPRYVVQKGAAAALDFAAVAAHAALVVRRYPGARPGLADSLVREAAAAWRWARRHPDAVYDQDRLNARYAPPVHTGAYGDRDLGDEFRWAAAELYLATRADSFLVAAAPLAGPAAGVPDWGAVATLGLYSLVDHRRELPAGFDTTALEGRLLERARALAERARASAYGVAMDDARDFGWGSNAVAANQGLLLVQAYRLTHDRAFLAAAAANLDYLLGRNATGYSFVTGYGAVTPRAPHHRPSAADTVAAPVPGFLVGGPNPGQQDRCAGYPSRLPARSYVDGVCAYAANEVAINWNAPLAYLAAAVDALSAVAPAGAARGASPAPTGGPIDRPADRAALAAVLRRSLRRELLDAWYPRAVDRERGGFLSQFDYRWRPTGAQDKMIVTQARHVWTTARAARFFPDDSALLPAARHGFAFLRDRMWDRRDGGFFWLVARDGTPRPEADGRLVKQAYGNAFGIYALAAYYDVARDPAALRLAQNAFGWLDQHAHDPAHGGYFNYLDRDGTPLREGHAGDPPKDQNSSIHLLEAFTELYRVWPDPLLGRRLGEMLALVRDTIRVAPGTLTLFSTADWRPVSWRDSSEAARRADHYYHDHVSFGHDVETAYLMREAAEALGGAVDPATERAAKQMVDHALRAGWDDAAGGFWDAGYYYPGRPGVTIVQPTKNWWAQAEGLNTLLLMADRYPGDPLRYGERFRRQWAYVDAYLIDHAHGGWYEGGLDREPGRRLGLKGHIWKAAYHDGRALMNVIRRLEATDDERARAAAPGR